jgi:hypothetical protein
MNESQVGKNLREQRKNTWQNEKKDKYDLWQQNERTKENTHTGKVPLPLSYGMSKTMP